MSKEGEQDISSDSQLIHTVLSHCDPLKGQIAFVECHTKPGTVPRTLHCSEFLGQPGRVKASFACWMDVLRPEMLTGIKLCH